MAAQSNTSLAIKGFAVTSTVWIGSAMASTSLIFVPALLRPLASSTLASKQSGSSHRTIARQFAQMDVLAFRAQVPLELLTMLTYGYLAYRSYSARSWLWSHWAGCTGLMAAVFPFTGALMVPYVHKLAHVGGADEPGRDTLQDREAEESNTVEYLTRWSALNAVRTLGVLATGALGIHALAVE